jgi:hypothetical protein
MLQPQEADAPKASKNSRFSGPIDPLRLGDLAIGYWLFALRAARQPAR